MIKRIWQLSCISAYLVICRVGACSEFIPLGFLDASDPASIANAVDGTGHTVVGESNLNGQWAAFVWQPGTGMQPLELSNGANVANAITPDGKTIVGRARTAQNSNGESFLTNATQGFTSIGSLTATSVGSSAQGISADGQVVVGWSPADSTLSEAYRWTRQGGFEVLGGFVPGTFYSDATAISPDGSVIVGETRSDDGAVAYYWSQASGLVSIGDLPGGEVYSGAISVSNNGKVIVGDSSSAQGDEAFRWDQTTGMVGLGFLSADYPMSIALSVTPNGSGIVGTSGFGDNIAAFVWDAAHGMRSLQDLLSVDPRLAGDMTGWRLIIASAISANGEAIVGRAFDPQGNIEGFLVLLDAPLGVPEPSGLVLVVSFCALSLCAPRFRSVF